MLLNQYVQEDLGVTATKISEQDRDKGTNKGTGQNKNAVSVENTAFFIGGEAGI